MAITLISLRGGVSELVDYVDGLQAVLGNAPTFTAGIVGGGLAVVLIGLKPFR
jgi:hypothetical protein